MDIPSRLDLYAIGRDYIVQRATKIDPAQVDILGSDVNIFVGAASHIAYALVLQICYAVNRLLLDGAEGEDLDRYAWDRYQLTRKGASSALGTQTFYRAVATVGAGTIPIGTKVRDSVGDEYITTTTITFGASDLSKTGTVAACQAGKATQVGANQLNLLANASILFDTTLLTNNYAATAGGEDVEDDDTFRERIRDFWNTARRGTLGAIEYGAIQVPGVVTSNAIETYTTNGQPARVVNLYIADSSGVASNALAALVDTQLMDYRAAGISVVVFTSMPVIVNIVLSLSYQANTDSDTLEGIVMAAVVEYVNSLPVNGTLEIGGIQAVLKQYNSDGLITGQGSIVSPTGDLVPAIGQTIRTTLANVTLAD